MTPHEEQIAKKLFTEDPHVFFVYNYEDIKNLTWDFLAHLRSRYFKYICLFGELYAPPEGISDTSVPHKDGYHLKDPVSVCTVIDRGHKLGFKFLWYINGTKARKAMDSDSNSNNYHYDGGMEVVQWILNLVNQKLLDGIYWDNAEVGWTLDETAGLIYLLYKKNLNMYHHTSIVPHAKQDTLDGYSYPWKIRSVIDSYMKWTLVGETQKPWIEGIYDEKWFHYISTRLTCWSTAIGSHKPHKASPFYPWSTRCKLFSKVPFHLCMERSQFSLYPLWELHYWPAYKDARELYKKNKFEPISM